MSAVGLLARSWARQHRVRLILVGGAIALAVALVVVSISGNRAIAAQAESFVRQSIGAYDALVVPKRAIEPLLPAELVAAARADADVTDHALVDLLYVEVRDSRDATYYDTFRAPCFGTDRAEPIGSLAAGEWLGADDPDQLEAVLSGALARQWQVGVGDDLDVEARGGAFTIRVIGITSEQLAIQRASGLQVRPAVIRRLAGGSALSQQLFLDWPEAGDREALIERWESRAAAADPAAKVLDLAALQDELGLAKAVKNFKRMGLAGAAIALIAAAFLVGSALAIGVRERSRQLALLRAIGMTRGQVAAAVLGEALLLCLIGAAGGVLVGAVLLVLISLTQEALFPAGAWPDPLGVVGGIVAAVVAGLLAAARPAWQATRAKPLDAVGALADASRSRRSQIVLVVAAGICGLAALTIRLLTPVDDSGLYLLAFLGLLLAALMVATRPILALVRRCLAPLLARLMGLPRPMVGSGLVERAGVPGTVWTLTTGLGLYIAIQAWGTTMVAPFLPSAALPDMVISVLPAGMPDGGAERIRSLPQIRDGRVLPLAVEQTLLGPEQLTDPVFAGSSGTVLLLAADPARAFAGEDAMLPLEWIDGDPAAAVAALADQGGCIVPQSFAQQAGLTAGDRLTLTNPADAAATIDLPLVAIANLSGWHWITKMSGMRTLGSRPVAPVFIALETARQHGFGTVKHCYADVVASATRLEVRSAVQAVAEAWRHGFDDPRFGRTEVENQYVKLTDTRDIANRMQTQADRVVWLLGAVPLVALAVAALGVAHTILADLRSRRWELGVLRSIGLEGHGLARLVLADALIIGGSAAVLSLCFGLLSAEAGIAISVTATGAAGGIPPLDIPWLALVVGVVATLVIILAAAWWPARRVGRQDPLDLLQLGRAAR